MISEHRKYESERGVVSFGRNIPLTNYYFLICIDSFNPFRKEYRRFKWFYKEGYNPVSDFSNTLEELEEGIVYYRVLENHIVYNNRIGKTPFKFSVTFRNMSIHNYKNSSINCITENSAIRRERELREEKIERIERKRRYQIKQIIINADKTFRTVECVICLINPPNVLFCNCGHIPICEKCNKTTKNLMNCPVCKTNTQFNELCRKLKYIFEI